MADRIQLRRTKGWRLPAGAVVVSRPTIWGNPWRAGNPGNVCPPLHPGLPQTRWPVGTLAAADAVQFFRGWIEGYALPAEGSPWRATMTREGKRLVWDAFAARRAMILSRLPELRGRDLACWCPPGCPCHADVLMRLANE